MGNGNLSKKKGLLGEITQDRLDYIADRVRGHIEPKVIDAAKLTEESEARQAADKALSDALVAEAQNRADGLLSIEEQIENEKKALSVKIEDVADALLTEEYKRAEEDAKLRTELDKKVDKEDGVGLSAVYDISFLESPDNADNWYTVIEVLKQRGDSELKLYSKEQTDEKLAEKVSKEEGKGLSTVVSIDISESNDPEILSTAAIRRVNDLMGIPQTIAFYSAAQIDKKLSELPSGGGTDLSNYYTKAEVDEDLGTLTDEVLNIKYDMPLKQDIVNVSYRIDEPDFMYSFGYTHNMETRLEDAYATSISFAFNNNVYVDDYISSLSFDSGETPTRIDYTNSGILNWVGTDCSDNNGYSIFKPEANKHYDIVFYFNGRQFIGLVNGFVPSIGNVVA